ncbi:hypothetical protein Esi_0051_0085 [Ectocarpus siliculosus]|uniref:Uncharacterized protein n=1 Tax=Ectocarpus siliculosus TaxID=2880 RepID=D7G3J1_ECTSI|nr:hypothetical protein Esi_0051_0085 [Ectocarpus siliculosus]|eukprot:CBJ26989.1 hypothetical protein Esi_0051_0085 [Ectocarpus siliculosus]
MRTPEAFQRVHDWIEVREDLLARVASLDPKLDANQKNIRPMYAHLLLALRRATVTLIRLIADGQDVGDGKDVYDKGCFMWKGTNYLAKICQDTAFLESIDELQRFFGETSHDNPLAVKFGGLDAPVQHDLGGTECDVPPRRRSFFAGLDKGTLEFVFGVLRQAQKYEEDQGLRKMTSLNKEQVGGESNQGSCEACPKSLPEVELEESRGEVSQAASNGGAARKATQLDACSSLPPSVALPKSVDMLLVREFALRVAAKQQEDTLDLALRCLRNWAFLAKRLRETRTKINLRFEGREEVRKIASQRDFFVRLKQHSAAKNRARQAANRMLGERCGTVERTIIAALAANVQRARSLDRSAGILKDKFGILRDRRRKSRVLAALIQACEDARLRQRKAEGFRADGLTRLCVEAFGAWASAAGLAGRLRKRLGLADRALLKNLLSAWVLFSKHSIEKRLKKEERTMQRAWCSRKQAWDTEVLDEAFVNWANLTAATKFRRIRLSARALRGWAAVARAEITNATLSREKKGVLLASARTEADARFKRASWKRLADFFEGWATEAGLASRLRLRLGKADLALVCNAFSAWTMFARHAARKREARQAARATQKRNSAILRAALWAWADVTAADKFFRIRLGLRVLTAWRTVLERDRLASSVES